MINLIPKPNKVSNEENIFLPLECISSVNRNGFSDNVTSAFEERLNINLISKEDADIIIENSLSLKEEEYILVVNKDGIQVTASSNKGVIWALTTLYGLLKDNQFPYVFIEDNPKYSYRGFMLDCARHFFSVEVIKNIIEQNALVKLNTLHWHLTDDQAWRMESYNYPKLHQLSGNNFYSKKQILDIIQYATIRGIDIIPEIDMPGHTTAAIAAYPSLSCKGEQVSPETKGGIYKTIFCAGKEDTYRFAKKILDEVCEIFSDSRIHIGGDEAPKDEWEQCPHCKAKLQ